MCVQKGQVCLSLKRAELCKFSIKYSKNHSDNGVDQSHICISSAHNDNLLPYVLKLFLRFVGELAAHEDDPDIGQGFGNHKDAHSRNNTAEQDYRHIESKG